MENSVKKEQIFGKITVDKVEPHSYKDGVMSAQLRQTVEKIAIYPGKNTGNDKQDSLFDAAEFGGEPKEYRSTQTRVCWVEVPAGSTIASVQAKLDAAGNARIYQIVSTDLMDCLTDGHRFQLGEGNLELTDLEEKFSLKDSEGGRIGNEDGEQLYRALYFSATGKEDIYNGTSVSEAIESEESDSGEVA